MSTRRLGVIALASLLSFAAGCAEEGQTPADFPPPPPPVQAPVVAAPPPAAPPEPTAEEKKKAEDEAKLAADFAKFQVEKQAEIARWTPEMHKAAEALAGKTYPTGHAAI